MRSCFVLVLAAACASAPTPPAKPAADAAPPREVPATRTVSVLELRNKLQPREAVDTGYVADRLRAEVLSAGIDAKVISRENMLVLLQAQGKQIADCEGECEVETGRRIGADLVVSGEVLRVGESLKASLRLHETQSGTLVAAATAAATTPEDLDARLGATAAKAGARGMGSFDARSFAAGQPSPFDCEGAARRLRETAPDQAWAALVACVERQGWPRGDFTYLERITSGYWDQDLVSRPDAPRLIARIIAARGGDVEGDIPLVQKSRVPLFTLAAALRQPEVYRGRWVLVRGALSEIRQEAGKPAAMMRETSLRATSRDVQVGTVSRVDRTGSSTVRGDVQASGRYSASSSSGARYSSSGSYSASGSSQYSSSGRTDYSTVKQRFDNERVETGRLALGRLAQADPFLEPEKDFLFLARFDGVSPARDPQQQAVAVLSIAGYYQPSALLVQ
jgi:TolB-like protein